MCVQVVFRTELVPGSTNEEDLELVLVKLSSHIVQRVINNSYNLPRLGFLQKQAIDEVGSMVRGVSFPSLK